MKGRPTHIKLAMLEEWWVAHLGDTRWSVECQVGNYLGALRRGGQLDENNQIRKYL
jgi:hypothetical protein